MWTAFAKSCRGLIHLVSVLTIISSVQLARFYNSYSYYEKVLPRFMKEFLKKVSYSKYSVMLNPQINVTFFVDMTSRDLLKVPSHKYLLFPHWWTLFKSHTTIFLPSFAAAVLSIHNLPSIFWLQCSYYFFIPHIYSRRMPVRLFILLSTNSGSNT